jgi:hypothetical protein
MAKVTLFLFCREYKTMKKIPYYIIGVLIILLLFGYLHYSNKTGKAEVSNIKEITEAAIKHHRDAVIKIEADKAILKKKIETDSIVSISEKVQYEKTIASLQKKLKATHYTGNPSTVPDDSVKMAMDYLSKKKLNDSIATVREFRVVDLNTEISELRSDYTKIWDDNQAEINHLNEIISEREKQVAKLEDENKKQRRKGLWGTVKYCAGALFIGCVVGFISK